MPERHFKDGRRVTGLVFAIIFHILINNLEGCG